LTKCGTERPSTATIRLLDSSPREKLTPYKSKKAARLMGRGKEKEKAVEDSDEENNDVSSDLGNDSNIEE
jgi:hypothetical protein